MANVLISPRFLFVFVVFILAINIAAISFGWYLTIPWLDNIHHFLGGLWIGLIGLYLVRHRPGLFTAPDSFIGGLLAILALTALAGAAWEVYEFVLYGILAPAPPQFSHADTISDLCFDLLGGAMAFCLARKSVFRR
ncbi:MAG: hypothetical protein AAB518_03980 [Patescibacteria group bacterium]